MLKQGGAEDENENENEEEKPRLLVYPGSSGLGVG
jgi:hypothetical protein